jgi:hypothetical protein
VAPPPAIFRFFAVFLFAASAALWLCGDRPVVRACRPEVVDVRALAARRVARVATTEAVVAEAKMQTDEF